MEKKQIQSLIALIATILIIGNVFFFINVKTKEKEIEVLLERLDKQSEKLSENKKEITELKYRIQKYEEAYDNSESEDNTQVTEETNNEDKNNTEEETSTTISNVKINEITLKELEKKIENKESFVLLVSMTSCSHCIMYKPIFSEIINANNIEAYDIDIEPMSPTQYQKLDNLINLDGTPTTIFFKDGVEIEESRLVGYQEKDILIASMKKHEFMK